MSDQLTLNLDELNEEIVVSTRATAVHPANGNTVFFPVLSEGAIGNLAMPATAYFNSKPTKKVAFYAYVQHADATDRLPEGYDGRIVPMVVAQTVFESIKAQLNAGYEVSSLNDDGTWAHKGDAFIINRSGNGTNTRYSVTCPKKAPATPDSVELPEQTLRAFVEAYDNWQKTKDVEPTIEPGGDDNNTQPF